MQLVLAEEAALIRAAMLALREVEDDTFDVDVDDVSADGIAVEVDDPVSQERWQRIADAAYRLLLARLAGAPVIRARLVELRERHGEDALLVALSGVADALGRVGRPLSDAEIVAVHRARADARTLLQAPRDVDGDVADGGGEDGDADDERDGADSDAGELDPWATGSTLTVARALASAVNADDDDDTRDVRDDGGDLVDMVVAKNDTYRALLRVRAGSLAAAVAFADATVAATIDGSVRALPCSPDELLFSARGPDAVGALIRATSALSMALPDNGAFSAAIVAGSNDLVADTFAAASIFPAPSDGGHLALDAWAREEVHELAELPGQPGVVDPKAPYGQERWELSALLARPAFHGRDDDVSAIADVLARGGSGPRALILGGPAGIGKSSLLRQALREGGLLGDRAAVAWGAADPLQPTPYAAVVGMVRALARAPAGHPRASHRVERLVSGLAAELGAAEKTELLALSTVIKDLVGASDDVDDDLADRRSPRALRTSLRRAVLLLGKALLARAGDDRPLIFVVSGAEAMDAPTRDALTFVGARLGAKVRVVLLAASSKTKLPPAFEELFAVTRRDVRPLDDESSLTITRELLDVSGDDVNADLGRFLKTLSERARGSPLFAAHATRWAVEGGYITRLGLGLGWTAQRHDVVGARLPTRIDKLLAARVQRLPHSARQVLGHCAALGSTFMPAAVDFVGTRLGMPIEQVHQAVRLLTETGFLARSQRRPGAPVFVDDDVSDDALLVFEHPLLRAAAEQALSDDEAKAIHGVVADALEALLDTRAVAPRLARHHKLAERRRQAVMHLVTAVRRARRLDDRQGAIMMANEALELVAHDERELIFTLQLELAAVLELGASQGEKAQRALKDALKQLVRAADKTADPHRQSLALGRVARFNLFLGDVEKAEEAVLRALARAREADSDGDHRGVRDVLRLLALICFAGRDLDGATRALDEARRLTPATERRVLGGIEHQTGLFHLESNDPLGALEHLLVAFAHKRATADLAGEAACLDAIADVYVRTGHLWTALGLLVRALGVREAIGDDAGFAQSLKNRADVLLMAGDVEAAADEAQRARALSKSLGLDRLEHQSAIVIARAELARQDAAAAESVLESVRRRVDDKRDPFSAMESELLSARAKWLRAQNAVGGARDRLLKSALARARTAVELGERRGFLSGQVLGNALLSEVLLSFGDVATALPHAQRAAELLDDRVATGLAVEEALGPYAAALRAMGDEDEAAAVVARARGLLEERAQRLPRPVRERFWSVPARRALLDGPLRVGPPTSATAPTTTLPTTVPTEPTTATEPTTTT